jgi:hypothetical protein
MKRVRTPARSPLRECRKDMEVVYYQAELKAFSPSALAGQVYLLKE